MKRAYADIPEGQIHYRIDGLGENVLLIHEAPLSADEWAAVIPILGKSYRVIAPDCMGYGNSDLPDHPFSIEEHAAAIVHLLDALGVEKTNLVGNHTGAAIAVEVAAAHPKRVHKLVLSGCPNLKPEKQRAWLTEPGRVDTSYRVGAMKDDGSHLMNEWQARRERNAYLTLEQRQMQLLNTLRADLGRRSGDLQVAIRHYRMEPRLQLIEHPTLLYVGTNDFYFAEFEDTKKLIKHCKPVIVEGPYNQPGWETPVQFAAIVDEFLKDPAGQ